MITKAKFIPHDQFSHCIYTHTHYYFFSVVHQTAIICVSIFCALSRNLYLTHSRQLSYLLISSSTLFSVPIGSTNKCLDSNSKCLNSLDRREKTFASTYKSLLHGSLPFTFYYLSRTVMLGSHLTVFIWIRLYTSVMCPLQLLKGALLTN